jgi:cholesterol oxidase
MAALRNVIRALPSDPLLDDHEVADNWQPEAPPTPAQCAALGAYIAFQHKLVGAPVKQPTGPFDDTLAPAGFPVFMLDTRSQRSARSLSPGRVASSKPRCARRRRWQRWRNGSTAGRWTCRSASPAP